MTEQEQTSKLEQEVSPVEALEVILRIGNNREDEGCIMHFVYDRDINGILHYLQKKGYISEKSERTFTDDYTIYYAPLSERGREFYNKAIDVAKALEESRPVFVVTSGDIRRAKELEASFSPKYELTPEDEEQDWLWETLIKIEF